MEADERYRITQRVTLTGAAVNCGLASLQIAFGLLGKSQALLADGFHTLSDLSTDFIVLYASRRSSRAADKDHPYGHGRIETMASMVLGAILGMVGVGIGIRGVESVMSPSTSNPEVITIFFAGLAIVAKEGLYHYTRRAAAATHSSMLEANAWHHRSDALSSIVVVIGISAQLLGIPYMDAAAAIIVACMIAWMGLRLSRKALNELIDTSLDRELIGEVRAAMQDNSSVIGVHNLRSRSMGGLGYLDAHIEVDSNLTVSEAHYIAHRIEHQVKQRFPKIIDVQIHIDPLDDKIRDSVLARLPERQTIEQDLVQAWEGIAESEQILQTKLHYLDTLIEIDLVLPASMCTPRHEAGIGRLKRGASDLDYVGTVNIYFVN
ncbi:MAG: cation diffusion facilitator family transporter [Gammaproteobacteria bacterium]|jgi:cation diffusion facilitator family transporter|nr:cation diffusion facilitator family transporter [Gammaproteobacteria bacterium]